jgi:NADPH-dependent 2,4-dienoyl-CoA reductase/sulfur reductase-like enzyme
MSEKRNLVVIGAGPAGLAAAVKARSLGLDVVVLDEQPAPGGQVWRALEAQAARNEPWLPHDTRAEALIADFRSSGADYRPNRNVWQIEPGFTVFASANGKTDRIETQAVLLAAGAQERPVPFPGWTLPGVMTVGAAQILLKSSGQIPDEPVFIAGSGPLLLLYANQLLAAGGRIAGMLDTTLPSNRLPAMAALPEALRNALEIMRGLGWIRRLKQAKVPIVKGVSQLEALGQEAIEAIRYRTGAGEERTAPARLLLVHEGVVPSIHMSLALGCRHFWSDRQFCFVPQLDEYGQSSVPDLFVAGDGTAIGGVVAACLKGELAAIGAAVRLGHISTETAERDASVLRRKLGRALATRRMLDMLYRPRAEVLAPSDDTIVCRCEEITAGQVRAAARVGIGGVNQVKTFTRCGMGPCQGRQCGYTVSALVAEATGKQMDDIGFYRIRPPLKPVTLGELASIESDDIAMMA